MSEKYYTCDRSHQIVLSLLKAHGIRKVIASPGTTNIALVGSMQNDSYFEMYSAADERSAAYLACGLSAESGEAVVLSCTGATASRNYVSGLTEAYYRKLPIIAITSTQSQARIGHNFAQAIDRSTIQNDIAKISVYVQTIHTPEDEWDVVIKVNKALLEAKRHGGGPVHIDLVTAEGKDFSVKELPHTRPIFRIMPFDEYPEIPNGRIGIFAGSHLPWTSELTELVDCFCESHNAVVFCDQTSGYKGNFRVQSALVASQENYSSKLMQVDLLIHIGEVTGDYYSLGKIRGKQTWRISEDGELRDTFKTLRYIFEMPENEFFKHYLINTQAETSYFQECVAEDKEVRAALSKKMAEMPFSNIWLTSHLASNLPESSALHLGILHSLRCWNFYEIPKSVTAFCNVGGFGIDGDVSSLIGASLSNPDKLYFGCIGDLAFFYDMNSLGNRHVGNNLRILLVNNGRGTEFRNYSHPGSAFGDAADNYIAAGGHYGKLSPNLVKHYAEDLGFEYISASTKEEFLSVYEQFISEEIRDKSIFFEVFTTPENESDALKMIRTCLSDSKIAILNKGIGTARNILGDDGLRKAVGVARKLHLVS